MTEHGTNGKLGKVAGRSDQGKSIVHTIDPAFILGIAEVSAFGAKKYHMRNFLMAPGMEWSRVQDSAMRHLLAHWNGEDLDAESGLPHILHAAWNIMVLFTYWNHRQYADGDDRPSSLEYQGLEWKRWKENFDEIRGMIENPQNEEGGIEGFTVSPDTGEHIGKEYVDGTIQWRWDQRPGAAPEQARPDTGTPDEGGREAPGGDGSWLAMHTISEAVRAGRPIVVKVVGNITHVEIGGL